MIVLGGEIAHSVTQRSGPGRDESIREAIDRGIPKLIDYFRQNVIPAWESRIESEIVSLNAPIIHGDKIGQALPGDIATILHSFGMLGVSEPTGGPQEYKQRFLTQWDDAFGLRNLPLPASAFYFLHPWMFDLVKQKNAKFKPGTAHIIGNGCRYRAPDLLRIAVRRRDDGLPLLYANGLIDCPGKPGKAFPRAAMFFFSALRAFKKHGRNHATKDEIKEAVVWMKKRFDCGNGEASDPFDNSDHKSHLLSEIRSWFPGLSPQLDEMPNRTPISWLTRLEAIRFDFVDVHALDFEEFPETQPR
jgi:hypothetical protein